MQTGGLKHGTLSHNNILLLNVIRVELPVRNVLPSALILLKHCPKVFHETPQSLLIILELQLPQMSKKHISSQILVHDFIIIFNCTSASSQNKSLSSQCWWSALKVEELRQITNLRIQRQRITLHMLGLAMVSVVLEPCLRYVSSSFNVDCIIFKGKRNRSTLMILHLSLCQKWREKGKRKSVLSLLTTITFLSLHIISSPYLRTNSAMIFLSRFILVLLLNPFVTLHVRDVVVLPVVTDGMCPWSA